MLFWQVWVDDITVNGISLGVSPAILNEGGGTIVDSGTTRAC
jgi:hypothetical protein